MASAKVEVTLRGTVLSGSSAQMSPIPLETFKTNKEMGRVLLRRGGETVAAGVETHAAICLSLNCDCDIGVVVELL